MKRVALCVLMLVGAGWLVLSPAWAQAPSGATVITIPSMDCGGCAKKVVAKLNEVPGVGLVQTNVKDRILIVQPKAGTALSPLGLWEAVERAGKQPSRLEGPHGAFIKKPTF